LAYWLPPADAQPIPFAMRTPGTHTATATAKRPFHEAMNRRTRRARHSWQVFGLAGAHRVVLLVAVASQSVGGPSDQCC